MTVDIFAHWHATTDEERRVAWDTEVVERAVMARFANGFPLLGLQTLATAMGFVACDGVHCDYHDRMHGCYDEVWDTGLCTESPSQCWHLQLWCDHFLCVPGSTADAWGVVEDLDNV